MWNLCVVALLPHQSLYLFSIQEAARTLGVPDVDG